MLAKLFPPYVVGVGSRVIGQVISFLAVAVASRYLDLADFGTYAFAWALTVIGTTFVFTGFYQALLRSQNFDRDRSTLFWAKLGVGAIAMLVIFVVGLLQGGLGTVSGLALISLAPLPLVIVPTAWWEAQLVRDAKVRTASVYVVLSEALGLAAAVALLSRGWGIEALVASRYVSTLTGFFITGGMVRALPRFEFRRETLRDARSTTAPLWGTTSVGLLSNYGADLVLGAFLSPAVVGAYRGGARIAMTATDLVVQPLGILSWSRFTRIEKEGLGRDAMKRAWIENMSLAAALLWPIACAVSLLAPMLVVTILDETWLAAASIVAILSVSKSIAFLSGLLEPVMITTSHGGRQLQIRSAGAATLVILLFAVGRYGPEAAAYSHLGASVVVGSLSLIAISRALQLRVMEIVTTFLPAAALTLMTYAAITLSTGQRESLGREVGLGLTITEAAAIWLVLMVVFLRRRVLVLPTP
ncbi:oligosaccharide flippase family protein [Maritimibacter sp. UBA3975]|uniref:oligosaccharide flippase family protein n=1 Tax=Maritimibacter sp. UBA3975 TaxID=1946833 RepID=UPI000C09B4E1|nr:oligosaccharide flippase family protein [Maritimibacter sp. UBA3975]MAM63146.1 translocase [Maritimibacter sp.]|tara:strand:+ start:6995 stop:8410 length:1416 start_codon:yes stop_codon:yes gene_type:complete